MNIPSMSIQPNPTQSISISKQKDAISLRSLKEAHHIHFLAMLARPPQESPPLPPKPPPLPNVCVSRSMRTVVLPPKPLAMRTASPTRPEESPVAALEATPSMRSMAGGMRRPKRARRAVRAPPVMRGMMTMKKTFHGCRLAQWTRSRRRRLSCLYVFWTKP